MAQLFPKLKIVASETDGGNPETVNGATMHPGKTEWLVAKAADVAFNLVKKWRSTAKQCVHWEVGWTDTDVHWTTPVNDVARPRSSG